MVLNNIKIRKIEMVCMKCSCTLFEYYVIGSKVKNYRLLVPYKPIKEGNICASCWKKEKAIQELESKTSQLLKHCKKCNKKGKQCDYDKCSHFKGYIEQMEIKNGKIKEELKNG